MTRVRVLRPAQIAGVNYAPDTVLTVTAAHADRLEALGLVVIVDATPAPGFYQDRMLVATQYKTKDMT